MQQLRGVTTFAGLNILSDSSALDEAVDEFSEDSMLRCDGGKVRDSE